ncbi:2-amino-4-hydroxy-6-hydroxymethyldihydropteridine diphosphokinase [Paracoccus sp. JM45]|uniref:2-amino-4-hydroxy-6- hydroxymethyldihydropteridine diphosphokinase n=1 Tax=Paracoccus sp. JM45 TaxID=2283626 RepID=UPI000E6B6A3B|nr:2-amino-4-hydroxy-6-hydroxymethyldihydropteridine diphosphokinase [Paracoccus sp. JM45]RJE79487.1 2-amino-4-hydroxy-6-hydroxymethyldihydropteridine diphosphokinase [Paracoccus sp. JM45]
MVNLSFGIVALGANLPVSAQSLWATLGSTLGILHKHADISICSVSRFWKTPAFPAGSGPDYANAVALVSTKLSPTALLTELHRIEAGAGRDRTNGRWSARVLDLDLVAYDRVILPDAAHVESWIDLPLDQQKIKAPDQLILPHPRLQDRAFVLAPMAEIVPNWRHPMTSRTVAQMLADLPPDALAGIQPMPAADLPAFA